MDPKTLWDRANDAINTIIRRDESTETGEFLQPCIEGRFIFLFLQLTCSWNWVLSVWIKIGPFLNV